MMRIAACALALAAACGDNAAGTTALFQLSPPADDFYALPFPNDLRRHDDGTLDLSQFPTHSQLVDTYRQAAESLDGFGLNSAIFARFDGAIDPRSLPDPAGSLTDAASVYLVDVDPGSPDFDRRTPVIVDFRVDGTDTMKGNRLVVRPVPGFGLDEGTTYALVITRRVHGLDGGEISPSADFRQVLATKDTSDSAVVRARMTFAPLLAWLDRVGGDERADVASATVFTTQHATSIGLALRKGVFSTPAPVSTDATDHGAKNSYNIWLGTYTAPNFQAGDVPYASSGGNIEVGPDGAAIVQRMEPMRFALTVPMGPTPATGWPICIYAHGTGGDWESFIQDGTADYLAKQGIAVISTDQVLHGPRNPGGDPETAFFNFANPDARDNALQGAADAWSQMRLALGLSLDDTTNARTITFDPARVSFFGHSQGGLTGPAFIAFEPALTGAVLSGTGGIFYLSALYKTQPISFPDLLETLARDSPMDEDNPSLALAQMWVERDDGANYARFFVRDPQTPAGPRNIFQTEGFTDSFAPNQAIEAFASAVGGDLVDEPAEQPVPGLTLRGRGILPAPITDNDDGITAVLAQYKQAAGSDGHYVVFDIAAARTQSSDFLGTLARTGHATVVTP